MRETKSMRIMLLSVFAVIIVAVPITYMEYSSHNTLPPLPQISVQSFNSTYTYIVNKTSICYPTYYEYLQNVTSKAVVSENGSKSSSISLTVRGGSQVKPAAPMGLTTTMFVCVSGFLLSNLRPSGLTILQGIQTPPNVPEFVSDLVQPYNDTNISWKSNYVPGYCPSLYSNNASSMAFMHFNQKFINEPIALNTTMYHFKSLLCFYLTVGPLPHESGNWSTIANLFPLNFTTALTITGLSRLVQEQVIITIPRVTGGS